MEKITAHSKVWENFFNKFNEIDSLPLREWKERHLLYYFCKKYESTYNRKYIFTFDRAPTKSREFYIIKNVIATTGSSDPKVWKQYIDWIFETKIIAKGLKIKTINFLATQGFGNEFQAYRAEKNKIFRSTELPEEVKCIGERHFVPISTYGDLSFVQQMIGNNENEACEIFWNELLKIGFDPTILVGLK